MMNDFSNFGWHMGPFGWILMVLFWGLIVFGIVAVVKWFLVNPSGAGPSRDKTPMEILKERYARGEIDKDEFEQKKRDLQ